MARSDQNLSNEDREYLESLVEENRLLRVLLSLQTSKLRALEDTGDPAGAQSAEPTNPDLPSPHPAPGSSETSPECAGSGAG